MAMSYDNMADIGPRSQAEVHRVYHALDDIGVRLAHQIAARGYSARMQPNEGDVPLPAMALAGRYRRARQARLDDLARARLVLPPRRGDHDISRSRPTGRRTMASTRFA